MCGRYGFIPGQDFITRFEIENAEFELRPVYNAAPGMIMPVVTQNSPKKIEHMKWGLVPFWAKDPRIGYRMINARSEGIETKPSFRASLKNRRCLIPASGFFEWARVGKEKTPYYFRLKSSEMFAFAGLYDIWKDAENVEMRTYTIITAGANELVARIHDRMPVILSPKVGDLWADNSAFDPSRLLPLLKPYPEDEMNSHRVSPLVNDPTNNSADILDPV